MKKIFLTLMVVIAAMTVNAQDIYVGGSLGFWSNSDAENDEVKTSFSIEPEIGYNLSENWSLGIVLSYDYAKPDKGDKFKLFGVNPYARYNFVKAGALKLFLDGGFEFATADTGDDDNYNAWNIGIKPGISYSLNDKFSLVAHMGFLGYQDCDDEISKYVQRGFGFNFSNEISFGVYYNF